MTAKELGTAGNAPVVAGHVDTEAEVPSAAWGWSGESKKAQYIAGIVTIVALLAMLIGNQKGHVEAIYLIGFAAVIAVILIRGAINNRRNR